MYNSDRRIARKESPRPKTANFGTGWPPPQFNKNKAELGCIVMPEDYFIERLRAQEDEISALRETLETARQRGNKKLMGISRKRLQLVLHLREMYQRMLKREGAHGQA